MRLPLLHKAGVFFCICLLIHSLVLVSGGQYNDTVDSHAYVTRYSLGFEDGSKTNWAIATMRDEQNKPWKLIIEGPEGEAIEFDYATYRNKAGFYETYSLHEAQMEYQWYALLQPILKVILSFPNVLKAPNRDYYYNTGADFDAALTDAQNYLRHYWTNDTITVAEMLDNDNLARFARYFMTNPTTLKVVRGASIFWAYKMIQLVKDTIDLHPYRRLQVNVGAFLKAPTIAQRCAHVSDQYDRQEYPCPSARTSEFYASYETLRSTLNYHVKRYMEELVNRSPSSCYSSVMSIRGVVASFMNNLTNTEAAVDSSRGVCDTLTQFGVIEQDRQPASWSSSSNSSDYYKMAGSADSSCRSSFLLSTMSVALLFSFIL